MSHLIEVKNINKFYNAGENKVQVLNDISLDIEEGKMYSIVGPSGSGKSTFLNVIGALDRADSGSIIIDGKDITKLSQKELVDYRQKYLGFIFQFYNLLPDLKIVSRYYKSLANIKHLIELCDILHVYDNTVEPVRIIRKHKEDISIYSNEFWSEEELLRLLQ